MDTCLIHRALVIERAIGEAAQVQVNPGNAGKPFFMGVVPTLLPSTKNVASKLL